RLGLVDDAAVEELRREAAEVMRRGIAQAEGEPPGDVGLVFEHAYVDPPKELAKDLEELRRMLER
ncbi:MAG: hypothetical protein ICV74_11775, partial [Thermoleophilia bacterium]|nr:hypothetical protein [Thermoleophilia bacterium]